MTSEGKVDDRQPTAAEAPPVVEQANGAAPTEAPKEAAAPANGRPAAPLTPGDFRAKRDALIGEAKASGINLAVEALRLGFDVLESVLDEFIGNHKRTATPPPSPAATAGTPAETKPPSPPAPPKA